jgi:hypothetical protein
MAAGIMSAIIRLETFAPTAGTLAGLTANPGEPGAATEAGMGRISIGTPASHDEAESGRLGASERR